MSTRVLPFLIRPAATEIDGVDLSLSSSKQLSYTLEPSASPTPQRATLSLWFERTVSEPGPFGGLNALLTMAGFTMMHADSGVLTCSYANTAGSGGANMQTIANWFPFPSGPRHVVLTVDTTQAVATHRMRLFVDGVEVTSFALDERGNIVQGDGCAWFGVPSGAVQQVIGSIGLFAGISPDGIVGDVIGLDGIAITDPSVFTNGLYSGPYGARGFHLDFADPANLGNDISGNGRHFTSAGLSPADHVDGWLTL